MGKRHRVLLTGISVVALIGLVWALMPSAPREPVYRGKSLSEWLSRYMYGYDAGMRDAIRHIGTDGIPTLLQMLRAHDSRFKLQLVGLAEKQHLVKLDFVPAELQNREALMGFSALGPAASNAVPDLIQIVEERVSETSQCSAIDALSFIGPEARAAVPGLLRLVGNTNTNARYAAIGALGQIHTDPGLVVPALIGCLKDPDFNVRLYAADALASFGSAAKAAMPVLVDLLNDPNPVVSAHTEQALKAIDPGLAVPALIKCLNDSDLGVRLYAIMGLRDLGSDAKASVPALVDLLKDPDPVVSAHTEQALKAIDPESAAKAGVP